MRRREDAACPSTVWGDSHDIKATWAPHEGTWGRDVTPHKTALAVSCYHMRPHCSLLSQPHRRPHGCLSPHHMRLTGVAWRHITCRHESIFLLASYIPLMTSTENSSPWRHSQVKTFGPESRTSPAPVFACILAFFFLAPAAPCLN